MPRLENARHEAFARAMAEGMSANEAYAAAGYEPNDGNCIRLKGNERIAARVAELQEEAAERTIINIETITKMFLEDRQLAYSSAQSQAAQNATEKLAKLYGLSFESTQQAASEPTERSGNNIIDYKQAAAKARAT